MNKMHQTLQKTIQGEVRSDAATLRAYSVDASIYEIEPILVVTPINKADILATIQYANIHNIPIISRGAATGITGGCLGRGIILDLSKYFTKILQIDIANGFAICQPGVIQDQLNGALNAYEYRLGPDTSTGNRATIGGMLANNSAGAHSLLYGKMVDHVLSVEIATAQGELVTLTKIDDPIIQTVRKAPSLTSHLYNGVLDIAHRYKEEIKTHFPKIPRRVSGYNLDEMIDTDHPNLAKLIAGSEGTLGVITEIKMRIVPALKKTALCIVHFKTMQEGMKAVIPILAHRPIALEMIDQRILNDAKNMPNIKNKMAWLKGDPAAVFIAEFEEPQLEEKLAAFQQQLSACQIGNAFTRIETPGTMKDVWDVRKAGLSLLLSKRSYSRAIAFIEDLSVAPQHLADFMQDFTDYLKAHNKEAGIYGHVGAGCMHIRPYIDLRDPLEASFMQKMMIDISNLVLKHGGAMSGEHGDGLIRSWLNPKMFGPQLNKAFEEIKVLFDPYDRFNPGKIVHGLSPLQDLRSSPSARQPQIETFQDFTAEGGFELAVDLCNGNAQCRKSDGLMCPSFQATGDEFDTTRARAQALRAVINGNWKVTDFSSKKVYSVLDLCLECKGCKKECPSQVDMAKMKAEFLYHYQQKHGYLLRNRLFAHIPSLFKFAHPFARWFNFLSQTTIIKKGMSLLGISKHRTLPALAAQRFSTWVAAQRQTSGIPVVLFNDTFTEFNQPEIGRAAYRLFSKLGYQVIVPPWQCCGRTLISKGFLREARKKADTLIGTLIPYVEQGIPIVGLEPSCILTLKDEMPTLVSKDKQNFAKQLAKFSLTFDEFCADLVAKGHLNLGIATRETDIALHGHCHQKALVGMQPTLAVLQSIRGININEIPSGCCGMAGSFGYESEHADISLKIGGLHLFPAIHKTNPNTQIIANGFSCRMQILHGTGRKAVHLAEFLADF